MGVGGGEKMKLVGREILIVVKLGVKGGGGTVTQMGIPTRAKLQPFCSIKIILPENFRFFKKFLHVGIDRVCSQGVF